MPHRVLVVDDTPEASGPLATLLKQCGFDVDIACNGADGLSLLNGFAPDVVILDLNMPVLDGYAFLEATRKSPAWCDVRVIVFTADHEADEDRLRKLGVVQVCRKAQTSFEVLLRQVENCLGYA